MLKKILAMLLAFVMMLSLTACGGNKPTDNDAEPDDGKKQERCNEHSCACVFMIERLIFLWR